MPTNKGVKGETDQIGKPFLRLPKRTNHSGKEEKGLIGKDSIIPISKRTLVTFMLVFAMLAALVPSIVFAADNESDNSDNVEVSFQVEGSAVTVTAVALEAHGGGGTSAMDPQTEYVIRVTVNDSNTLNDVELVKVTLFYDADGTFSYGEQPTASDNNTCAIMTWTNGSGFAISPNAAGTTWSIAGDCSAPSLTLSSGDFEFHFTPGKVARENAGTDMWHACAQASDDGGGTWAHNEDTNLSINWYGELTGLSGTASFSTVSIGCDNVTSGDIAATYISNGDFYEQVRATTSWTGPATLTLDTTGAPGDAQFSLLADDDTDTTGAVQVTGTYQSIDDTGAYTSEDGHDVTQRLWLSLGDTGIPQGTYTGYVWYQILTR